jgi:hypothetical protein
MDEGTRELLQETNRKLGVVIALLANSIDPGKNTTKLRDQIRVFNQYGLKPSEIAGILNRTPKFISKEMSLIKKMQK